MSVITPMPTPIIQMGHVEKIAEVAQNHPEAQQQAAQELAREANKRDNSRIIAADASAQGRKIGEREAGGQGERRFDKKQPPDENAPDEAEADAASASADPWTGKILNVTV